MGRLHQDAPNLSHILFDLAHLGQRGLESFVEVPSQVGESLVEVGQVVGESLVEIMPLIGESLVEMLKLFGESLIGQFPLFGELPTDLLLLFGESLIGQFPLVGELPTDLLLLFGESLIGQFPLVGELPTDLLLLFGESLIGQFPLVGELPTDLLLLVGESLIGQFPLFGELPTDLLMLFGESLIGQIPLVCELLTDLLLLVCELLTDLLLLVGESLVGVLLLVGESLVGVLLLVGESPVDSVQEKNPQGRNRAKKGHQGSPVPDEELGVTQRDIHRLRIERDFHFDFSWCRPAGGRAAILLGGNRGRKPSSPKLSRIRGILRHRRDRPICAGRSRKRFVAKAADSLRLRRRNAEAGRDGRVRRPPVGRRADRLCVKGLGSSGGSGRLLKAGPGSALRTRPACGRAKNRLLVFERIPAREISGLRLNRPKSAERKVESRGGRSRRIRVGEAGISRNHGRHGAHFGLWGAKVQKIWHFMEQLLYLVVCCIINAIYCKNMLHLCNDFAPIMAYFWD